MGPLVDGLPPSMRRLVSSTANTEDGQGKGVPGGECFTPSRWRAMAHRSAGYRRTTGPTKGNVAHLEAVPRVAVFRSNLDRRVLCFDCRASWMPDDETRHPAWDFFAKPLPPPG